MSNYKIKVNTEAESREAQDLFEQLGFKWAGDHPKNGDWYSHLYAENSTCCYLSPYVWGGLVDRFKEITLPQLRDLVAQSKNEQGLISGADALRALADGKEVEYFKDEWMDVRRLSVRDLTSSNTIYKFRLKPSTITLNVEIPAPFEPKDGEIFWFVSPYTYKGYDSKYFVDDCTGFLLNGVWRTEEQIKQVVAALRGALK